jgi:SAM-dependent methyltransferase
MEETLEKMSGMRHFNEHMFRTIRPFLGTSIVEAGSGHGNITDYLLSCGEVTATDVESTALERLHAAYTGYDNIRILRWDMTEPLALPEDAPLPDTVVCLNVLEHIEDHHTALVNARRLLEPTGGRLVLLVPAHAALYSPLDEQVGHFRRYSRQSLEDVMTGAGFEVEHVQWFNLLGFFGWWLNGRVLERERLPTAQLGLFEAISGAWLQVEKRVKLPTGLSLIAAGRPSAT